MTICNKTVGYSNVVIICLILISCSLGSKQTLAGEPLPGWANNTTKQRILDFVQAVSDPQSKDFVPQEYRIATFDMDGTLVVEKPNSFVLSYSLSYFEKVANQSQAMRQTQPYKAVYENDQKFIDDNAVQMVVSPFIGMTEAQYQAGALKFIKTHKHQRFNRFYINLFYVPMVELVKYLQANDFRVYVFSGSWQGFVRAVVGAKIPFQNSNLVGSQTQLSYYGDDKMTQLFRTGAYAEPTVNEAGKVLNIEKFIGEKPILAFGNSNGDQQMMEYASNNSYRNLSLWLEHDDPEREYKYASGVDKKTGWIKVSMKKDFVVLFD